MPGTSGGRGEQNATGRRAVFLLMNAFYKFSLFLILYITLLNVLYINMPRVYNWELYQEELADMYLLHNMQLKDIMTEMFT